MTKDETKEMLAILRAAYPHSFKDMKPIDAYALLNLWSRHFADDDPNFVLAAVDSLISTRTAGYSPTIGEVKEQMQKLRRRQDIDEASAWAMVSKACTNGLYGYREEYEKLPPQVQRAVGAPEQLREWAKMDVETVQSVVASNFMRTYRTMEARAKEMEMLPGSVKELIGGLSDRLRLTQGEEDHP